MSKAVLISIQPKWCKLIANGKKTIEIRKSRPKLATPFKCYIYCTRPKFDHEDFIVVNAGTENAFAFYGGGLIIGEFVCDSISEIINVGNAFKVGKTASETNRVARASCLDFGDMHDYLGHKGGYGWHISKLKIFFQPKKLSELRRHDPTYDFSVPGEVCRTLSIQRPPQSWCYVEELP